MHDFRMHIFFDFTTSVAILRGALFAECCRRRPNLNEKFVQFGNKRLINAQKMLTNGTDHNQTPAFSNP